VYAHAESPDAPGSSTATSADDEDSDEDVGMWVEENDPDVIKKQLRDKVREAMEQLPRESQRLFEREFKKLAKNYSGSFVEGIGINEEPAEFPLFPDGIKTEVDDVAFGKLKPREITYPKPASDALHEYMTKLERAGYLEKLPMASYASNVHIIKKHNVPPEVTALEKKWRVVTNLKPVNAITKPAIVPIPKLSVLRTYLTGMKFFGKLDLNGGYWQATLHESCRKYFAMKTDRGVWIPKRLPQGSMNAAGPFHAAVASVLGELLFKSCLLYIDDILIFGRTLEEYLTNFALVIAALHAAKLKISIKKTLVYAEELEWCGFQISAKGVAPNPKFVEAVLKMPKPVNAAQLRQFVASVNFVHQSIPRYTELIKPLQDLLNVALATLKDKKTQAAARRVNLVKVGWSLEHETAFVRVREALVNAVTLAHVEDGDEWELCVIADSSQEAWSGMVTQRLKAEESKPLLEQHHRVVAFTGGRFDARQSRWPIVDKEAFAIMDTCRQTMHLLHCKPHFHIYTDHRNLKFLFAQDAVEKNPNRVAADRLQRWIWYMQRFCYTIHAIPGDENVVTDMFSRWAAAPLSPVEAKAMLVTTRARARTAKRSPSAEVPGESKGPPIPVKPVQQAEPALESQHVSSSEGLKSRVITPDDVQRFILEDAPSEEEITAYHANVSATELKEVRGVRDATGIIRNSEGRIYVPDVAGLRLRLLVVAHQSTTLHRGSDTTYDLLKAYCFWPKMAQFCADFCQQCLTCFKTRGGKTIPRPLLHSERATAPNQLLHFDFFYVRGDDSPGVHKYVLVIIDNFSRFVQLVPCVNADAGSAATALLNWFASFGIPQGWTSDRGAHFNNDILSSLAERYGITHHFTAAYAPWSNGMVERVNREVRELLSAVMLDKLARDDDWVSYLPLVNHAINATPSQAINGHSPLEVFCGHKPVNPLVTVFRRDPPQLRDLSSEAIDKRIAQLRASLDAIHSDVASTPVTHRSKKHGVPVDFVVGDFVLISREVVDKVRVKDKTRPIFYGPARVLRKVNERVFEVEDISSWDPLRNARVIPETLRGSSTDGYAPPESYRSSRWSWFCCYRHSRLHGWGRRCGSRSSFVGAR
jgi:transposase InsO family protein